MGVNPLTGSFFFDDASPTGRNRLFTASLLSSPSLLLFSGFNELVCTWSCSEGLLLSEALCKDVTRLARAAVRSLGGLLSSFTLEREFLLECWPWSGYNCNVFDVEIKIMRFNLLQRASNNCVPLSLMLEKMAFQIDVHSQLHGYDDV